jgi:hypothetical protein
MSNTVADWTLQGLLLLLLLLLQQVAPPASNVCFLEQAMLTALHIIHTSRT